MIVVPIPRGENFDGSFSIVTDFFQLTIGQRSGQKAATRLLNSFIAISSLGNIIITTFTAARGKSQPVFILGPNAEPCTLYIVKQEIAKEEVLPYSLLLQRNINVISKIFRKRTEDPGPVTPVLSEAQLADTSNLTIPGQSPIEPIPVPALMLHCFFT
jgi:hypothetical protein